MVRELRLGLWTGSIVSSFVLMMPIVRPHDSNASSLVLSSRMLGLQGSIKTEKHDVNDEVELAWPCLSQSKVRSELNTDPGGL